MGVDDFVAFLENAVDYALFFETGLDRLFFF
jgi:hypothetical protein